ncbi:VOC family protein [Sphingopyxis sp. DBS4]|uniref:VOC family protein n=1 Tax=Sphingopyxis sp. DBS4 TaxID=2968500 RepID=UPI00214CCF25|nr:VOC family protein [Sphingopyxis sp. DBS4]
MIRIHHVGYVVRDLNAYAASLPGLEFEAEVVDEIQNARIALYRVGDASRIELIQPLGESAFTWAHLNRSGEGLHHICYEGIGADAIDDYLRQHRLMRVRGPVHAVLFDRNVLFAVTRQRAIVEFIL